jgi:peptide/nickel transport system substrate-binding protein
MSRLRKMIPLLLALSLIVAACGGDGDAETTTTAATGGETTTTAASGGETTTTAAAAEPDPVKDTFSMTIGEEPPSLDIVRTASSASMRVLMYNVLETIVELDPETGEVVPGLAESWEVSDDQLTYTFNLREGATFSDGSPVLASDVVFSLEAKRSEEAIGARSNEMAPVDTITAIDDRTVEVVLSNPSIRWLLLMGRIGGVIFQESTYADIQLNPIGSGPFMIDEWVSGDRITLVPNPHWDGEGPYLSRVDLLFIDDLTASINALLSGQIDAIWNLRGQRERIPELEAAGMIIDVTATQVLAPVVFNVTREPFTDIRVRQAVAHAIDKQGVIDVFDGGFADVVHTWVSPIEPWHDPDFEPYPYDLDRARELLAEAGYPDGLTFELSVISNNPSGDIGEIVALMLSQVGITAELKFMEVAPYLDEVVGQGQHVAGIVRSSTDLERWTGPMGWHSFWDNEEYDELVLGSDSAATFAEYVEMRREAGRILGEELPAVVINAGQNIAVYPEGIEGWIYHKADSQSNDVRLARWTD